MATSAKLALDIVEITYVIEALDVALLLSLVVGVFDDTLNLSRDGLVGAESLLANSLVNLLDVVEELGRDAFLFCGINEHMSARLIKKWHTIELDGTVKDLVGECVALGQVFSGDWRAGSMTVDTAAGEVTY
jgi:hypothetical protein